MPTATGHTKAIRATRVIGTEVKDNGGNVIGKVEDLILDKTGTVTPHPTVKADLKDVKLEMNRRYKLELSIFDGVAYVSLTTNITNTSRCHRFAPRKHMIP